MIRGLILSSLILLSLQLEAQGIKGKIVDTSGEPLPFASIALVGTSQGIASNIEGEYYMALPPGRHRIRFQYLGYTPIDTTIQVGNSFIVYRAVMRPEVVALPVADQLLLRFQMVHVTPPSRRSPS